MAQAAPGAMWLPRIAGEHPERAGEARPAWTSRISQERLTCVPSRRAVLLGAAAAGIVAGGGVATASFRRTLAAAEARISQGSSTIETGFGTMEWGEAGSGTPILMIHGTGGGYDQGLAFCRRLSADGFRVIAPSRFGYLRSGYPDDPSSAQQADAFVDLLDHLGIDKLPVAGGSAGALSAIEFAIRHPDRCSALIAIVPASYAPERPSFQPMSWWQEKAMRAMLESDLLFWAALGMARDTMIGTILATDPALVSAASAAEQARVGEILSGILPVSRRSRGLMNDARLASDPARSELGRIRARTLAISVEDDRFGTADAARHIAREVPGTRLVVYPTGGHVWVGHDEELFAEIAGFVRGLPT